MSRGKAVVEAALAQRAETVRADYARHVNPKIVEALGLLGYGRDFVRAQGTRLWDAEGREYLDFLGSYGAAPLGHNHPEVVEAVRAALDARAPNFCQVSPQPLAAALAKKLAELAPGDLQIAYLMSSGSEAVDGALKLARAATRRARFVSAR